MLAGFSTAAMAQEAELNAALQAIKNNAADKADVVKTAQKKNKKNPEGLVAIGRAFYEVQDTAQARNFANLADEASKHKYAPAFILLGDIEAPVTTTRLPTAILRIPPATTSMPSSIVRFLRRVPFRSWQT